MGGASHGSSLPAHTCPFDLITSNHFAHNFISSWLPQFFGYKVHSDIRRTPNLAI